jgi:endonuclease/exonuclease/phosphatase family metal-dependent hydrolase
LIWEDVVRILTCNVRTSRAKDGDNDWLNRKDVCIDVIRAQNPDIICCQEVTDDQFADLGEGLPDFQSFGMADEPASANPVNAIFYRRGMFRHISSGGYWLSQTPHVPGSSSWESRCVRLCNWLRLVEVSSGRELRVANTHLDHISQEARVNQARLINDEAAAYEPAYPQILTGDMNCTCDNPAIASFLSAGWIDTYAAVHGTANPGNTFHGFLGTGFILEWGKIDWILVRGSLHIDGAAIINSSINGRYPSDHYFLSADVSM